MFHLLYQLFQPLSWWLLLGVESVECVSSFKIPSTPLSLFLFNKILVRETSQTWLKESTGHNFGNYFQRRVILRLSAKLPVASYKSTSSSSPFPVPVVFASLDSGIVSCAWDKHTYSLTVTNPSYSRLTEIQKFRETQCPNHLMLSANICCRFLKVILFSLKKESTCPDTLREIRGQLKGINPLLKCGSQESNSVY